jgi:signal peptidase I
LRKYTIISSKKIILILNSDILGEKHKKNKSKKQEVENKIIDEQIAVQQQVDKANETQEEELTFTGEVIDFFKDLVVIVLIVLFIRTFLAMPFQINGQSMYSSYYDKEFIIVDRLSYRVSTPQR